MNKTKYIFPIGEKFGKYTIISSEATISKEQGRRLVKVQCDCGNINDVRYDYLTSGKSQSCIRCRKGGPPKLDYEGISRPFYHDIKHGAITRNIEFSINIEYMWNLFLQQNKKCALTGMDLLLNKERQGSKPNRVNITASLDRINTNLGYIEGNVQWVHKLVNIMKSCLNNEEFIYICKLVSNNNENFVYDNTDPSFLKGHTLRWRISQERFKKKEQRLTLEVGTTNNSDTSAQHPSDKGDDIV